MGWLTAYRFRRYVRSSAWLAPAAAVPVALAVAPLARWVDERTRWAGFGYTPDGARALLGTIAPASLMLIGLILSTLLLSVQLASSQFSPRLIGMMLARRPVELCLSTFVFTFVYCAAVLGRVDERVPQLPVLLAVASTLASVVAGLFLVDYMAKELRPVRMLLRTANVGRAVIEQVYPDLMSRPPGEAARDRDGGARGDVGRDDGRDALDEAEFHKPFEVVAHDGRSGVLLAIDLDGLFAMADRAGCCVEVVPYVGDFVARGDPLVRVRPDLAGLSRRRLRASMAVGNERTPEQDPAFAFRILVDVACKALSPAINDPTTAVLAIDQIHHLLRQVGRRRLDAGRLRDARGNLRLVYRTPDWEDFVLLAVTEIRQYGADSIQVARRLRAMLENLIASVAPDRAAILEEQLQLLRTNVQRHFDDPEDQRRAGIVDYQGVGSSRNGGTKAAHEWRPAP